MKANLAKAINGTVTKLGKQHHTRGGECEVFGQAAISQRLLSDIKSRGNTLAELARAHTWSTGELLPGTYALCIGTDIVVVTVTNSGASCTVVSSPMPTDTPIECHMVQVGMVDWQRYLDGDLTACIECTTNGCKPLMACIRDMQDCPAPDLKQI